jgi:hypothetical protein
MRSPGAKLSRRLEADGVDPGGLVVLGLMYVVFNALRKAGTKPRPGAKPTARQPQRPASGPPVRQAPTRPKSELDPTQREGARLQDLLRDLGRTLDQAAGPAGRRPDRALPRAEEVEPREQSLDVEPSRRERPVVDQDDQAEAIVAKRLEEASDHGRPLSAADHVAFDQRIRQMPADKTAVRVYTPAQLRDAIVWREILGPPVALRDDLT